MIKLIRPSTFETNSSSTHSLILQPDKTVVYDISLLPDSFVDSLNYDRSNIFKNIFEILKGKA